MSSTLRGPVTALAGASVLAFLTGCGVAGIGTLKAANVSFVCDGPTNGGLLLTVDVVQASEAQVQRIRELGEKWFYDPMREGLRDRIRTVTFPTPPDKPRCEKSVEVPLPKKKDERFIVVVADYRFQSADPSKYVVVIAREKVKKKIVVELKDQELSFSGE